MKKKHYKDTKKDNTNKMKKGNW